MAAGHHEHGGGHRHLAIFELPAIRYGPARWWTATIGLPSIAAAGSLANDTPTSNDPTQPRPLGNGQRVHVRPAGARVCQRALDDATDVPDVLARRQLRHDAAPLAMDLDL